MTTGGVMARSNYISRKTILVGILSVSFTVLVVVYHQMDEMKSYYYSSSSSSSSTMRNNSTVVKQQDAVLSILNDKNEYKYTEEQPKEETKYLQYFVHGGWSNQIRCVYSAYFMAWATNRTLILSPVTPHFLLHFGHIFDDTETKQFLLDYDLQRAFLGLVVDEESSYVRLDQVLDIEYSIPNLGVSRTIDFKEFYEQIYPALEARNNNAPGSSSSIAGTTTTTWVVESNFSHLNTFWTYRQQPVDEREGASILNEAQADTKEESIQYHNTLLVARDVETVGRAMSNYSIWTFLDSFYAEGSFKSTNTTTTTSSSSSSSSTIMTTPKPRFAYWIRQTARQILDQNGWDKSTMPAYASVHIRGSDGNFEKPEKILNAISSSLDEISKTIRAWALLSFSPSSRPRNTSLPSPTAAATPVTTRRTVGLFVATDIPRLPQQYRIFRQKTRDLRKNLETEFNATLVLLFSSDLTRGLEEIILFKKDDDEEKEESASSTRTTTSSSTIPLPFRNSKNAPGIFLDQQVAACATIGFAGTRRSTFSKFINTLRNDQSNVCLL